MASTARNFSNKAIDLALKPDAQNNVIQFVGTVTTGDNVQNYVEWSVRNDHNDWVDVICETDDGGEYVELFQTGHIQPGDIIHEGRPLPDSVLGRTMHIYRWTPGLFGIPGSGGGEVQFTMPEGGGSVALQVTVVNG